jgi:ParB-like chromosome segregation protein Spo0J
MNELQQSHRRNWFKFRIANSLGPGEHYVHVMPPGPPVLLVVNGPDYDELDRPGADVEAFHPEIEGVDWSAIWEAVRRQRPNTAPQRTPTNEEYQTLKDSIATFGPLQRVVVDEAGTVIAGRLRKKACLELGVQCPTEVISGLTPEQKEQLGLELEFCRKQLSIADKRRHAEFLLKSNPRNTDRVTGRACGLDHKTVGNIRHELQERGEIPQVAQRLGGDGKLYRFPKVVANSGREEDRARAGLRSLGDDAPKRPLDLRRLERLARTKKLAEQRMGPTAPMSSDDSIQILHCDFRDLQIEDESVLLMMTDPPYDSHSLPLWKDLAAFAKRVLRPDGFLVTYTGIMFLPDVMSALSSELSFVWQVVLIHEGGQDKVWSTNVVNKYRPVLIFSKGEARSPAQINDVLHGSGKEKDFHEWQQNIDEFIRFIDRFSKPGDLVVDPFGGGFTTAAACHRLGRRCLTCDIDAESVQRGLERLAQERRSSNK